MSIIKSLKKIYRASRVKRWNRLYDQSHVARVAEGLKVLAEQGRNLSPQQAKIAEEYSRDVLGSVDFAPWLKLYTAFRGEFLEGWIPNNYLGRVVCPAVNGDFRNIGSYKTISKSLIQTDALPDIAYRIRGSWILDGGQPADLEEVKKKCFENHPYVFLKKDFSFQGNGVVKLTLEGFLTFDFSSAGDFVIQAPIFQHPFMEEISPGSVATLRITTVKPPRQDAKAKLCGLRIGRKGMEYIDSKICIRIPVWTENGRLFPNGITKYWTTVEKHPDTGIDFRDKAIPHFKEAVTLCEQLHDRFPHLQLIGWDAAITASGEVKLMEWNTDEPGIIFSEAAIGPHFQGLGWEKLWKKNQIG